MSQFEATVFNQKWPLHCILSLYRLILEDSYNILSSDGAHIRVHFEFQVDHLIQSTTLNTNQNYTIIFFLPLTKTSTFISEGGRSYEFRLHFPTIAIFKKELIKITIYFSELSPKCHMNEEVDESIVPR